jgi:hypothetical protein
MSRSPQLAVDTNTLMDATKPDGAADVDHSELVAAREVGARLLTSHILVYSKKVYQEWDAKGVTRSNKLLLDLLRQDRVKLVSPPSLRRGQVAECCKYVDEDDQPFVLAATAIEDKKKVLVTRDPKTTEKDSRRYVKKTFSVLIMKASEYAMD